LFPEPQQFRVTEQSLQGRQPPKQLNSFDQLGNFILGQLVFRGFRETIEIDRVLPLKQTKRSFLRGFADAHPYARGMLVVKGVVVPVSQICGWWWRSPGMLVVKGAAVPVSQICGWWCRSPLEEAPQICRWRPL
jgi:hypothetical protein